MKLARKLTAALTLGAALIWGGNELLRERRESAALAAEVARDHRDLGTALAAAIARSPNVPPGTIVAELAPQRPGFIVRYLAAGDPPSLATSDVTVTRVPAAGGVIELVEANDPRDRFLFHARTESVLGLVVLVALFGVLSHVLGEALITRRTRALIGRTRRIGEGDLSAQPTDAHGDELRELSAEIESMCARLRAARDEVARQSEERVRAVEQLRHADRLGTVGKLAAGIAHELGTPLNVVIGRATLASRAQSIDDGRRHAAAIAEAADRMSKLLRQLMTFARRTEPKLCAQPLAPVVERAVAFVEPLSRKHGVRVTVTMDASIAAAVDASQLEQVLVNLLVNAFQASPRDGAVEVDVTRAGEQAVITVRDHGVGIAERDLPRVFDPFFTTKDVGEGTGLGLSVARGIIEDHGGTIELTSARGDGTRVTVRLRAS